MQHNFWLAKPCGLAYGLANQKLYDIQILLNTEKSVEQD